jgi:hypothetical protein
LSVSHSPRSRRFRLALACVALALAAAKRATPSADDVLRRAEAVRSPDLAYAAEFKIRVVSTSGRVATHEGEYAMVVRGKDHTLVLIRAPKALYGGLLLITEGNYWMMLPRASTPFQLAPVQIVLGDVATGDIARANLARTYAPTLHGEEVIEGRPTFRLELRPRGIAPYTKVDFWVGKAGFLPEKLEYYGQTERLLRRVRYHDYVKGPLGLRSMRLEIESPQQAEDRSTLTFADLRKIDASRVEFTPAGMVRFRDAALARMESTGEQPRIEDLLAMLPR